MARHGLEDIGKDVQRCTSFFVCVGVSYGKVLRWKRHLGCCAVFDDVDFDVLLIFMMRYVGLCGAFCLRGYKSA